LCTATTRSTGNRLKNATRVAPKSDLRSSWHRFVDHNLDHDFGARNSSLARQQLRIHARLKEHSFRVSGRNQVGLKRLRGSNSVRPSRILDLNRLADGDPAVSNAGNFLFAVHELGRDPEEHGCTGWRSGSSIKHFIVSPMCRPPFRDSGLPCPLLTLETMAERTFSVLVLKDLSDFR
jgi:hypothetical protein